MLLKLTLLMLLLWSGARDGAPTNEPRRALLMPTDAPVKVMQSDLPPPPPN